ncbi:MAG: hypothetical protein GF308_06925 [Candidatus Heimdallarchaeota archaeon]|nr:hypothetical protein [Candidatus Heimdallarchaeota archaeon]
MKNTSSFHPHLDDVVLSLGGTISKLSTMNKEVQVITVYTKELNNSPKELNNSPKELNNNRERSNKWLNYTQRKKEDENALNILKANKEWWYFLERINQKPSIKNVCQLFHIPNNIESFVQLKAIKTKIQELLKKQPNAVVYFPLSVGNHYDHVELFLAAMNVIFETQDTSHIRFYEDYYAVSKTLRKKHFITKNIVWKWKESPERASFKWLLGTKLLSFCQKGSNQEELLDNKIKNYLWKPTAFNYTKKDFKKKIKAVACYTSQLKSLGGLKTIRKIFEKYYEFWNCGEPHWTIKKQ